MDSNNPGYVVIKTDATEAECEAAQKIHGIGVHYNWRRNYPMGRLACHVVGFTSADNRGIEGIEYAFDRDLRGKGAMHTFLVDVHRRPLGFCLQDEHDNNEMPMHGSGIILTIDATIQEFVREALFKQYKAFEAEAATAMVADPQTGAILAMVSLPDYDPADARHTDPDVFYESRPDRSSMSRAASSSRSSPPSPSTPPWSTATRRSSARTATTTARASATSASTRTASAT